VGAKAKPLIHGRLLPGSVRVLPYYPEWPRELRRIRKRLLPLFPGARIGHVGSMSIVGCWAKPIIDVSVGLPRGGSVHVNDAKSAGLDFRLVRPGSITFRMSDPAGPTIGFVHVYARSSEQELGVLQYRDYLRAHPEATKEYSRLKRRLAATAKDRSEYSPAQAPFIEGLEPRIRRWARRTRWTP
jgi:GrpB-like predicted nucleotidyltransferase (UPF0157 family)